MRAERNEYKYLTFDDRKCLEELYRSGERIVVIASTLGVCFATIYRELKRGYTGSNDNNMRPGYSARIAEAALQYSFRARGRKETREKRL